LSRIKIQNFYTPNSVLLQKKIIESHENSKWRKKSVWRILFIQSISFHENLKKNPIFAWDSLEGFGWMDSNWEGYENLRMRATNRAINCVIRIWFMVREEMCINLSFKPQLLYGTSLQSCNLIQVFGRGPGVPEHQTLDFGPPKFSKNTK
jgi:hypothetical protein